MGKADYFEEGSWNALCYECGFKFKANRLRRHWQGYYVCGSCWEPRQAQDFVRAQADIQTVPQAQPFPADIFTYGDELVTERSSLTENYDTLLTETSYPLTAE